MDVEPLISVYGATGFVGSNFVSQYKSIEIPRNERKPQSNEILYLISTTHNYHVFTDPTLDVKTNLLVLTETLKELPRDAVFNFVSSWFVYGEQHLPVPESMVKKPKGFYSITKSCAEDLVISYCKTHNIKYRILRLANVYGIGDKGASKKKNALQYLINKIKNDEEIELYHGGNFVRDYIHVKDACRAMNYIIQNGKTNEIYNIGSGQTYKFIDLMMKCYDMLEKEPKIRAVDPPEFHKIVQVKDMQLDISKLKNLGFSQEISIDNGLREICNTSI